MLNESFSKSERLLQVAWDSTSLGLIKECPYKYYLSIIEGYRQRQESHHLTFGIAYHRCMELYFHAVAEGKSHNDALDVALQFAIETSGERETIMVNPMMQQDAEFAEEGWIPAGEISADGLQSYTRFTPWPESFSPKTRFILIRSVIWYLDTFGEKDPAQTIILASGAPATELSFRFEPGMTFSTGEPLILCGHLDRVADLNGTLYTMDYKTTKNTLSPSYFNQYSPNNQMSMYSFAGKIIYKLPIAGVIVDAAQLAINFTRFQRGFANRTEGQLHEWLEDTIEWVRLAERFAEQGSWPMNDKSCSNYGGCKFRGICSLDPAVRKSFLESNFIVDRWNPLRSREV